MNIGTECKCYRQRNKIHYLPDVDNFELQMEGYCIGTKEYDPCSCGGDPSKCDFYKDKRKEKKMNTAEMWLKAQEDGKTYINEDLIYNKEIGFIWDDNSDAEYLDESWTRTGVLNESGWELAENAMTKEEAEAKFDIKIIG